MSLYLYIDIKKIEYNFLILGLFDFYEMVLDISLADKKKKENEL